MLAKVLVIEDDREINELLGECLAMDGYTYLSAVNGTTGVTLARQQTPDAVILDLMLPDVDGCSVCRQLKGSRSTYAIPVVMLTAMTQDNHKREGLAAGALHYLKKPFMPDDLLAYVRDAMTWRQQMLKRVPTGTFDIHQGADDLACRGLQDFTADVFTHTDLSDQEVADLRAAILRLSQLLSEWAKQKSSPLDLQVQWQLDLPAVTSVTPALATALNINILETRPGLLADVFTRKTWFVEALSRRQPQLKEVEAIFRSFGDLLAATMRYEPTTNRLCYTRKLTA